MIELRKTEIQGTKFYASEDFRYAIELHENGFINGIDIPNNKETSRIPSSMLDSVLSDMKESFGEDFSIKGRMKEETVKAKAERLRKAGYICTFTLDSEPSITIQDKTGKTVYLALGREAEKVIKNFEDDPVSLDTTISIEDYCLSKFL